MSRCRCCDVMLNEWELVRKNKRTGEYLDTCSRCQREVDYYWQENESVDNLTFNDDRTYPRGLSDEC